MLRKLQSSPVLSHLTEKAKRYASPQDAQADDLTSVVLRLNDFYAGLASKQSTGPSGIVREALKLDADLVASVVDGAYSLSYTVVSIAHLSGEGPVERTVWDGSYHVYKSIAATSTWNNYRIARILLREIIIDTLHAETNGAGSEQDHALVRECHQLGRKLVDDVCASVPMHLEPSLHYTEQPGTSAAAYPAYGRHRTHESRGFASTGACMTLLWPLLIAANSGFAPNEQRQWIIGCLDKIARTTGIGQASDMAQLLRDGRRTRAL